MATSTAPQPLIKPQFSRESRLGLVVYGNVALAVYMHGVCQEFYHAVRGRGIYKLLKALTDSDIVVDIVSGTSAGGINGVFLSYALANSNQPQGQIVEFKKFANFWRNSNNINQLLRQVNPGKPHGNTDSFFDGQNYYQQELASSFCKAWSAGSDAPMTDWFSEFKELDLFITGTDTLGKVEQVLDNTGRVIEIKNHRAVFILKHRQGRKEPFKPHSLSYQSLAKLCRITSCFPAGFPVVTIAFNQGEKLEKRSYERADQEFVTWQDLGAGNQIQVDRELILWGDLENRSLPSSIPNYEDGKQEYRLYFIDGGVLDSRPFTHTLKEIHYRLAQRTIERKLFYIDPNPDQFINSPAFKKMQRPNFLKVLEDSWIGLPTYESITNDLELIKERNQKISRYQTLLSTHQLSSAVASSSSSALQERIYLHSRFVGWCDRLLPIILNHHQEVGSAAEAKNDLGMVAEFLKSTNNSNHNQSQQISNLDLDYALRRHFFIVELILNQLSEIKQQISDQNQAYEIQLKLLLERFGRQIKLLEILQYTLDLFCGNGYISQRVMTITKELQEQGKNPEFIGNQLREYFLLIHRLFFRETAHILVPLSSHDSPIPFFSNLVPQAQKMMRQGEGDWLSQETLTEVLIQLKQKTQELILQVKLASDNSLLLDSEFKYDNQENQQSILIEIEKASETLITNSSIQKIDPNFYQHILEQFKQFRYLDQILYPFEYLTALKEKESIELVRISPDDAQRAYGKGKGLGNKLAGDSLHNFGSFFKKSWRSNDIMWGRLDGLNRLVDGLITRESLPNFSQFLAGKPFEKNQLTQEEYLQALVQESFPSSPKSQQEILKYLQQLATWKGDFAEFPLEDFRDQLVLAGHREILNTDLEEVIEDAIEEQFDWNHQSVIEKSDLKKILQTVKYDLTETENKDEFNVVIHKILKPNGQQQITRYFQAKETETKNLNRQNYLMAILRQSYPNLDEKNYVKIAEYPLNLAQKSSDSWQNSLEKLQEFLSRLITAEQETLRTIKPNSDLTIKHQNRIDKLQTILRQINPQYIPVGGYYDQVLNPLAAKELARQGIGNSSLDVKEDFFRNQYLVGSETLTQDIPGTILANLAIRFILIIRDIFVSLLESKVYQGLIGQFFQFLDKPIQVLYWWLQFQSPQLLRSRTFKPRLSSLFWIRLLLSSIGIASLGYIFYDISQSPNLSLATATVIIAGALFFLLGWLSRRFR